MVYCGITYTYITYYNSELKQGVCLYDDDKGGFAYDEGVPLILVSACDTYLYKMSIDDCKKHYVKNHGWIISEKEKCLGGDAAMLIKVPSSNNNDGYIWLLGSILEESSYGDFRLKKDCFLNKNSSYRSMSAEEVYNKTHQNYILWQEKLRREKEIEKKVYQDYRKKVVDQVNQDYEQKKEELVKDFVKSLDLDKLFKGTIFEGTIRPDNAPEKDYFLECHPVTRMFFDGADNFPCIYDYGENKSLPLITLHLVVPALERGLKEGGREIYFNYQEYIDCKDKTVEGEVYHIKKSDECFGNNAATLVKVPAGILYPAQPSAWVVANLLEKSSSNTEEYFLKQNLLQPHEVKKPHSSEKMNEYALLSYKAFETEWKEMQQEQNQEFQNDEL